MRDAIPRIVWRKPAVAGDSLFRLDAIVAPDAQMAAFAEPPSAEYHALLDLGIPLVEGAATAKEHALGLLRVAAEVEQALMVQYLYAASSIAASDVNVNAQRNLTRIAVQEMGHLATVQNLLLLVGGPDAFHLQRDELRKASPENPIPFVLRALDAGSLAEYVVAEMPADVPADIKARVDELHQRARTEAGTDPRRVGLIYTVLKWLFMPAHEAEAWIPLGAMADLPGDMHLADADLRPADEIARFQADGGEFGVDADDILLETCGNAREAVAAIDLISAQGEGLVDADKSHFQRFFALAQAFDKGQVKVKPLAVSPTLTPGLGGESGQVISHGYTRLWGEVFARQYGAMLLSILQALRLPRDGGEKQARRGAVAGLSIGAMKKILRGLLPLLADLPLASTGAALAGPPFDLDPAMLFPGPDTELTARQLDTLDKLIALYAAIERDPAFTANPEHRTALANVRGYDKSKRTALSPLIA